MKLALAIKIYFKIAYLVAVFCSFYLKLINNMKVKKFTIGLVAIGGILFGSSTLLTNQEQAYFPQSTELLSEAPLAEGMAEYYKMLRMDQRTGEIPVDAVLNARKAVQSLPSAKSSNISWVEMGPDNEGGRTRALIVDNQNPNRYIAGSVSGGIWISENRGINWTAYNNQLENLAISDLAQAPDGTIYFGTGPLFDGSANNKGLGSEMIGAGFFKMTGNGQVEKLIGPSVDNARGIDWSGINHIAIDPTNSQKIYVAQVTGLRASTDGGATWFNPIPNVTNMCQDVDVSSSGKVVASFGTNIYLSNDGSLNSFTNSPLPRSVGRTEISIAPSNENIIYASATVSSLAGIYKSIDGGLTWNVIGPGGSSSFDPFCSSLSCQGFYDNAIAVSPTDPGMIYLGGVTLWRWQQGSSDFQGSWEQVAYNFEFPGNNSFVHSDVHRILFVSGDELLVGSDGGVHRTENASAQTPTFVTVNRGYNVTQFYDIGVGPDGKVMGGTQDNGTIIVGYQFNNNVSGFDVRGGDGFDTELSNLVPTVGFASLYFGNVSKMTGLAKNFADINIDGGSFYNQDLSGRCLVPTRGCGPFYTSFKLWETFYDENSRDTISSTIITDKKYYHGDTVLLPSFTQGRFIKHALDTATVAVGDSLFEGTQITIDGLVDRYQSIAALANAIPANPPTTNATSIHITRDALKNIASTEIAWYRIAGVGSNPEEISGTIISMAFSRDGDYLFVGTSNGQVYRISGLNAAWQNDDYSFNNSSSFIKCKRIGTFGSRAITGIAVDPNNADNVVITCGNYNNNAYVYRTDFATTAGDPFNTFESIQGSGLAAFPVYSAVIDKNNNQNIIIGTEFGVYSTDNGFTANASDVNWTEENFGLAKVPVYEVQQQVFNHKYVSNDGMIYAGTHGRGIFRTDKFVGIRDLGRDSEKSSSFKSSIKMYPNPVIDNTTIEFNLVKQENVKLAVYSITGRLVHTEELGRLIEGKQRVNIQLDNLSSGSYIMTLQSSTETKSTKFIVQ